MYDYRDMTPEQRKAAVAERIRRGFPSHRPPHLDSPDGYRIITGTCFQHRRYLNSERRLGSFETELLALFTESGLACAAWCVLPNHYHALVRIGDIGSFGRLIGQLHGRTSFRWNREDKSPGRQVWYSYEDRCMRSDAHYYTSLNYIHNNPVKHGYVAKWPDWPFSSIHWYLATHGREWCVDLWRSYPVRDYGRGWDD